MRRRLVGSAAAILVVLAALVLPGLVPAAASPDALTGGDGMEVLCSQAGYGCVAGTGYHGQSVWGANWFKTGHNCTSYVSWRLAQTGIAQPWRPMGDGGRWDDNGRKHVAVDQTPAVGAVAGWDGGTRYAPGPSGHVAYVEAVRGDTIEITDDSHGGGTRRVLLQRGSPYWPSSFIHINDVVAPSMSEGEWTLTGAPSSSKLSITAGFGQEGALPVVGDWDGDGDDTVGSFHDGTWDLANINVGKHIRPRTFVFGQAGDLPVVGDWDGDGKDTVGVFRDGTWLLAKSNESFTEFTEVHLGGPGDLPVAGDWDGNGRDTFGVFHEGTWTLTDSPFASTARLRQLQFGARGDTPVVGDWDGVRGDTVGTFRNGTFTLASGNSSSPSAIASFTVGQPGERPVAGRWERKGVDGLGTVR